MGSSLAVSATTAAMEAPTVETAVKTSAPEAAETTVATKAAIVKCAISGSWKSAEGATGSRAPELAKIVHAIEAAAEIAHPRIRLEKPASSPAEAT